MALRNWSSSRFGLPKHGQSRASYYFAQRRGGHDNCRRGGAIEVFSVTHRDIGAVLFDLVVPGLDGREILAQIRRLRPDVKIIVTTASSRETATASHGRLPDAAGCRIATLKFVDHRERPEHPRSDGKSLARRRRPEKPERPAGG